MATDALSQQQVQQADLLTGAYLDQIEKEHSGRVQDLQHAYAIAHSGLVSFLTLLDPGYIDGWIKGGKTLAQLDDRFVQMRVTELLKQLREKPPASSAEMNAELQKRLLELQNQNQALQDALTRAKQRIEFLEQEIHGLQARNNVQQQVEQLVEKEFTASMSNNETALSPVLQGMAEPPWMAEWRKRTTFDRDAMLLTVIGETGISRRPKIIQLAAVRMAVKPDNSAIGDAIHRIEKRGLIERLDLFEKRGSETGGVLPYLYRLTDQGRQAYWLLSGKNALECEFDMLMKRHKSPEHTLLNMKVREFLEDHQVYQVLLEAAALVLPDGHKFEPDITARDTSTGELVYIEVEREANKDTQTRIQKWQNFNIASHGLIRVICDKPGFMRKLASEINFALSGQRFATYISNIEEMEETLASKGHIWVMERQ
jgi:Skp family chaperone for outer membrane proteins